MVGYDGSGERLPLQLVGNESSDVEVEVASGGIEPPDREQLTRLVRTGSHPAQQVRRARILLELDENDPGRDGPVPTQEVIAQRAGVHVDTVVKTSRVYAERGGDVEATISRKRRLTPPTEPKVTGEVEAG